MPAYTLQPEHARDLATSQRMVQRAQERFELETTRAKVPMLEAVGQRNALIDALALVYGFDPDRPLTFEAATGLITQDAPTPAAVGP